MVISCQKRLSDNKVKWLKRWLISTTYNPTSNNPNNPFNLLVLVALSKFWNSTEGGFLSFWHSSHQIQLRYLFLHKFKHFPDVLKLQKNFLLLLKWPDCCPSFISADTATSVHEKSGAQVRRVSSKKGFSYCRAAAFWCRRHHLTQFPSCLFQHLSSWHHSPVCVRRTSSTHCLLHCLQSLLLLPQNVTNYYVLKKRCWSY